MSRLSSSCGAGPNSFQDELGLQMDDDFRLEQIDDVS